MAGLADNLRTPQERLNALRVAGEAVADILAAEAHDRGSLGMDVPSLHPVSGGTFEVRGWIGRPGSPEQIIGKGDTADAALVAFLANRSTTLKVVERKAAIQARVEAEMADAA